jgi:hypothetical protein
MIYLAIYKKKNNTHQPEYQKSRLLFIEADKELRLDKVVTLVQKLTGGDFDQSSVEIIGQKDWDAAKLKHPRISLHQLL